MITPEEWGGGGLDTISFVLMMEKLARVDAAMATVSQVTNSRYSRLCCSLAAMRRRKDI